MNCEKCGHEMLVVKLGQFGTDYQCPVCGHLSVVGLVLNDEMNPEHTDLIDTFRVALIKLERLAYVFSPGSDERFQAQIETCRQLRSEMVELENRVPVEPEPEGGPTEIPAGADRMTCPRCAHVVPMSFIWPSPQSDPDAERVIGRFQHCTVCGWQGDAMIWKPYDIKRRDAKTLLIDGQAVTDLRAWLVQIGLIRP